jgi:hypothetical protein
LIINFGKNFALAQVNKAFQTKAVPRVAPARRSRSSQFIGRHRPIGCWRTNPTLGGYRRAALAKKRSSGEDCARTKKSRIRETHLPMPSAHNAFM